MKKTLSTILAVAAAAVASSMTGCATDSEALAAKERRDEMVTGSNISRRGRMDGGERTSVMTAEEFDRARESGGQGGRGMMPEAGPAR